MKNIRTTAVLIIGLALAGTLVPHPVRGEPTKVRVAANAAIEKGDVAGAQSEAQAEALQKAIEQVLGQILPERTLAALQPLLEARILPQTELFISNYQIVNQDVSDLAYTVRLSVTVDTDLLRKNLARIGVIKEPGSPPLGAVFVTVEAPVGLEHVRSLGTVAQAAVTKALDGTSIVLIPPPDQGDGFRVIRPPQEPETLMSEGLVSFADLAIGVLFRETVEADVTASTMTIPMDLSIQAVDVQTGTLVDTANQDVEVRMGTKDGVLLSQDIGKVIGEMASRMSGSLTQYFMAGKDQRGAIDLVFEGKHDAVTVRQILNELQFRLGETASIVPLSFSYDRSRYVIWTPQKIQDVANVLGRLESKPGPMKMQVLDGSITLIMEGGRASAGVLEFGEEVTFYRRLPVPGVENPDDIRKIEYVAWQENENNSEPGRANIAPVGMGILGRIDPPRDLDFFRIEVPDGTREISVSVEQTGPGEVRPRVRVFNGGLLLEDQAASGRGRNLSFSFSVTSGTRQILLSVEDYLGRYPSMFPYVLKVGAAGN